MPCPSIGSNNFGPVRIILTRPNCFWQEQMFWIWLKMWKVVIWQIQNVLGWSKTIWTDSKLFWSYRRTRHASSANCAQSLTKKTAPNLSYSPLNSLVLVKRQWWLWILHRFSYPYYPCFWLLVLYWAWHYKTQKLLQLQQHPISGEASYFSDQKFWRIL